MFIKLQCNLLKSTQLIGTFEPQPIQPFKYSKKRHARWKYSMCKNIFNFFPLSFYRKVVFYLNVFPFSAIILHTFQGRKDQTLIG